MTEKMVVNLTMESIFRVPYGFCKRIRKINFDNPIYLGTSKDFLIIIVDSSQSTPLGLFDSPKGSIKGSVSGGIFEDSYYDVSVDVYDDHIHEGVTCIAYEKLDSTYSNCVENAFTSHLLSWYSCLPSWIQSKENNICEKDADPQPLDKIIVYKAKVEMWKMMTNQVFTAMKQCKPPCRKSKLNIEKVYTHGTGLKSFINIMKTKPSIIYTATYSFGFFR